MSSYKMNQLVQQLYLQQFINKHDKYMQQVAVYIKQPGFGCESNAPSLSSI